jgi:hypothetical protein
MGMADSRCTDFVSSRLFNDALIAKIGVSADDAHGYRMSLQMAEPSTIFPEPACSIFSYKEISPEMSNE